MSPAGCFCGLHSERRTLPAPTALLVQPAWPRCPSLSLSLRWPSPLLPFSAAWSLRSHPGTLGVSAAEPAIRRESKARAALSLTDPQPQSLSPGPIPPVPDPHPSPLAPPPSETEEGHASPSRRPAWAQTHISSSF